MLPVRTPLFLSLLLCSLLSSITGFSQVYGCKDPNATNYNPAATITDSSCVYPATTYVPPIHLNPINDTLVENSGLQWAGSSLWTFNDSGNEPALYRISTTEANKILQIVTLEGATNVDWEDIAFDGTHFYIGDFGNNIDGARTDLKIYKFPISAINADYTNNRNVIISASNIAVIHFSYANRGTITPASANNTRFDCEAMIVDGGGKIHLFSKNWIDLTTTHYRINDIAAGTYIADSLETLPTSYLVTGADITPNGKVIVLLGYQTTGFGNHYMHLLSDYNGDFYFNGNRRKIDLPNAFSMGQAEGICFTDNSSGFISNEAVSNLSVTPKLRSFTTSSFVPFSILPTRLLDFQVNSSNQQHQISWLFSEAVEQLKIIRTKNGTGIEEIKTVSSSQAGTYNTNAGRGQECFKLSWKQTDGSTKHSSTICRSGERKDGFENVVLKRNGQLLLRFDGEAGNYLLRVISTDGKLIMQTNRPILKGQNTIQLPQALTMEMAILQLANKDFQKSILLKVQ